MNQVKRKRKDQASQAQLRALRKRVKGVTGKKTRQEEGKTRGKRGRKTRGVRVQDEKEDTIDGRL
eukprot:scaffold117052_cov13-Tisochrysis_lutea.AAC.1